MKSYAFYLTVAFLVTLTDQ